MYVSEEFHAPTSLEDVETFTEEEHKLTFTQWIFSYFR